MHTRKRMLIVDGYNVIGAWHELGHIPLPDARERLINRLHDYAGCSGQKVVLVFDAYQSDRLQRTEEEMGPLTVVYTKKGEIADSYIERLCDELAKDVELEKLELRVATSDSIEQTVVFGRRAVRISSRELIFEMNQHKKSNSGYTEKKSGKTTILEHLPEDVRKKIEAMTGKEHKKSSTGKDQ